MTRRQNSTESSERKLVLIYARVSSREQEEEGYSIEAQLKALRKYAEKNGFIVVSEYVDIQTAKEQGRKNFESMVRDLRRLKNCRTVLVEKMDRLSRNQEDFSLLKKMETEIHFVKSGTVYSKDAKAQVKFHQNIELATSIYYSDNLREEVIKGMREKAEQGFYPGHAPYGYRNNRETRNIEPHPAKAPIVRRAYELYAEGTYTLNTLRKELRKEFDKPPVRGRLHHILKDTTYIGLFPWRGETYQGKYVSLVSVQLYDAVQAVFSNRNRPKYRTQDIAFRGLMTCKHCGCAMTGERVKHKYVYYRCTGFRGKCPTPRFREADVANILGEVLRDIQIPEEVAASLGDSLVRDQERIRAEAAARKARLEKEAAVVQRRMDQAYKDKLDEKIAEDFWKRQMEQLQNEDLRIRGAISALKEPATQKLLSVARTFELAQKAHSMYLKQNPTEQAELLKLVLLNCAVDAASIYPEYKMPFDIIARRVKNQEWSGR